MNEEFYQVMKQLLEATVTQSEQRMMERMDRMDQRFDQIDRRFEQIDQRFDTIIDGMNQQTETIVEHIDQLTAATNAKIDDHEVRITRLERHAA